jgi:hypothetical protein
MVLLVLGVDAILISVTVNASDRATDLWFFSFNAARHNDLFF